VIFDVIVLLAEEGSSESRVSRGEELNRKQLNREKNWV
jgi:hypothetical protein